MGMLFNPSIIPVVPVFIGLEDFESILHTANYMTEQVRLYLSRSGVQPLHLPHQLEVLVFVVRERHKKKAILRRARYVYESCIAVADGDATLSSVLPKEAGLVHAFVTTIEENAPVPVCRFDDSRKMLQVQCSSLAANKLANRIIQDPKYIKFDYTTLCYPGVRSLFEKTLTMDMEAAGVMTYVVAMVINKRNVFALLETYNDDEDGDGDC